jgi:hypothetical protein
MRKKELRAHQRAGCAELVQVFDERKGDAAFAVWAGSVVGIRERREPKGRQL